LSIYYIFFYDKVGVKIFIIKSLVFILTTIVFYIFSIKWFAKEKEYNPINTIKKILR